MEEALELLEEISEHVGTCCAITMEPDEVQAMIDQLKEKIKELGKQNNKPYSYINMHEILHLIGLCPDSFAHPDLLDIVFANYESLTHINLKQIKHKYVTKRRWSRFFA